jgi:hypothetical protein
MKLMPSCRDVAETVSKENVATLSPWARFMFRVHLARCRDCRAYLEQIRALGLATRDLYPDDLTGSDSLAELEAAILEKCGEEPGKDASPAA